jgi:3'-5' exonuclease
MLRNIDLEKILFIDIETVPVADSFSNLSERFKELWQIKSERIKSAETDTPETLYKRAGIYAEFGKIICITSGVIRTQSGEKKLYLKSFSGHDEKLVLASFSELLNKSFNSPSHYLCAHNGKEFDFPYLSRRMLINSLPLPYLLDNHAKKPWETTLLDTMEMWRFGDYKNYTSLDLLAAVFDIPTPKGEMDGSMVGTVYWQEKNLEKIVEYCGRDVETIVQLFLKYRGDNLIEKKNISIV